VGNADLRTLVDEVYGLMTSGILRAGRGAGREAARPDAKRAMGRG